jgi:5-amino-6-(5-phosphoribosylamino)uracil reductase
VAERPYVLLSVATSIDGYIDDATGTRLILSNEADLDRVDEVRGGCDAILVGAGTIRRDDPALLVRSPRRRAARRALGWPASPVKVTLTGTGELDPAARFFTAQAAGYDEISRLIYVPDPIADQARARFGAVATVASAGDPIGLEAMLSDLAARGIRRLMVEGGAVVHAEFLAAGLADELHLVIAPLFVGDPAAPRFAHNGTWPPVPAGRVRLAGASQIGDVVLLRYLLSERSAG